MFYNYWLCISVEFSNEIMEVGFLFRVNAHVHKPLYEINKEIEADDNNKNATFSIRG